MGEGKKNILKKLSFIKDYSALFVSVAIILVALLLLIPSQLMSNKLRSRMEKESVGMGKQIDNLIDSAVPKDQWKIEQGYQQAFEQDSNEISQMAAGTCKRELLSYRIFPEPIDTSSLLFKEYGETYRKSLEDLLVRINARECPSEAELNKNLKGKDVSFKRGRMSNRMGEVDKIRKDFLCRRRAQEAKVYANPFDISGYGFWGTYSFVNQETALRDCWYWQLGYWVIEDIITTMDEMNEGSINVMSSPVKRLLSLDFSDSSSQRGGRGRGRRSRGASGELPKFVMNYKDGLTDFYTGHINNEEFEVIHFKISIVLDSKSIVPFMKELCSGKKHIWRGYNGGEEPLEFMHNQITILENKLRSVDLEGEEHALYYYGDVPVMKLDLICEYLLNKKCYEPLVPEIVKKDLAPASEF